MVTSKLAGHGSIAGACPGAYKPPTSTRRQIALGGKDVRAYCRHCKSWIPVEEKSP